MEVELQVGMWIRPRAWAEVGYRAAWPARVLVVDIASVLLADCVGTRFTLSIRADHFEIVGEPEKAAVIVTDNDGDGCA